MISDILDSFDYDLQKAIIDNYQLKDGLYIRVGESWVEYFLYKRSKKKDIAKEVGLKDLNGDTKVDDYYWFAKRDYISVYLNSNKAIDPPQKKIHNNNYLTLFVKAKEFNESNREYFIEKLYNNLKNFSGFSKKKEIEVINSFKDYILDEQRQKDIDRKEDRFLGIFNGILDKKVLIKDSEYIKIFFDEDLKKYEDEAKIYYALKIYNKIDTVVNIDGDIFGLSDFNMGLNAKKPYLEHKTRGFKLPYLVSKNEIFKIKELFDFLKYQKNYLEISPKPQEKKNGIFLIKHSNNDQSEIIDFDILVNTNKLIKPFVLQNYVFKNKEDEKIEDFFTLFKKIDDIFYAGVLENNLFGDVYSKLPHTLQNLIYLTRDAMIALNKGEIKPLLKVNKKFADDFMLYYLRHDKEYKAKEVLNLKLSLLKYEGDEIMNIKQTLRQIEQKIEELEELTSEEFFILSGQIIKYLLDKSKKSDKRADMIEPFLRAGKSRKLKQEIETLFFTYKHELPLNFKKFNNALALVESYDKNEKVQKDKLLVGILSENIFYRKDD